MPFQIRSVETHWSNYKLPEHDITIKAWGEEINPNELMNTDMADYVFLDKAIVKCEHCGQWAARKTPCVHCGAPVD